MSPKAIKDLVLVLAVILPPNTGETMKQWLSRGVREGVVTVSEALSFLHVGCYRHTEAAHMVNSVREWRVS